MNVFFLFFIPFFDKRIKFDGSRLACFFLFVDSDVLVFYFACLLLFGF